MSSSRSSFARVATYGVAAGLISAILMSAPASAAGPSAPAAGTVVSVANASGPAVVPGSAKALVLTYRMTSVTGMVVPATGLVLLPKSKPPAGGWPFVVYGHVTTGAADSCAPSRVTKSSEAYEFMTRGDAIATRLLEAGVAVLRPDFEGIGVPGPHPYLIGRSLATSTVDMVTAARRNEPRLGRDWVVAGHSEGGVGALFTASASQRLPADTRLRGAVAFTPVTQTATELNLLRNIPLRVPLVTDGFTSLAGLLIGGASTVDPAFRDLLADGGLSTTALAKLPHLEERCLPGLTASDSWGGLAPGAIPGRRGSEAVKRLEAVLKANDPAGLTIRSGLPVRIDAGITDLVAPLPFTDALAARYRSAGVDLTYKRWLGGHPEVVKEGYAAAPAVAWMLARLR